MDKCCSIIGHFKFLSLANNKYKYKHPLQFSNKNPRPKSPILTFSVFLPLQNTTTTMRSTDKRSDCPISYCLDFFGDKWTLLILRDIVLYDKHTFGEFLEAEEKIATNVLTDRLKMLEKEDFIRKHPVEGKARVGYWLTPHSVTIIPVLVEMAQWGAAHNKDNDNANRKELADALKKNKPATIK